MIRVLSFAAAAVALAGGIAAPARAEPAHGFAVLGTLKYPAGFPHFDYSNPHAPKGGNVRLWAQGGFDTLNPFILKGRKAAGALMTFETLMMGSGDEPDSYYGLIAKTVELPDDRRSITFDLRPEARFQAPCLPHHPRADDADLTARAGRDLEQPWPAPDHHFSVQCLRVGTGSRATVRAA